MGVDNIKPLRDLATSWKLDIYGWELGELLRELAYETVLRGLSFRSQEYTLIRGVILSLEGEEE